MVAAVLAGGAAAGVSTAAFPEGAGSAHWLPLLTPGVAPEVGASPHGSAPCGTITFGTAGLAGWLPLLIPGVHWVRLLTPGVGPGVAPWPPLLLADAADWFPLPELVLLGCHVCFGAAV